MAKAPPPSQAMAALDAAAPLKAEIAVPVEAVPKVVATHIAAVGAVLATKPPAVKPAPINWLPLSRFSLCSFANSITPWKFCFSIFISSKSITNSFG